MPLKALWKWLGLMNRREDSFSIRAASSLERAFDTRDDDHLVCLLYDPVGGHYEGHELNSIVRSDTTCTLLMNAIPTGFYLYLAFVNSKRNRISDSVCVRCESARELHVV